MLGRSDIAAELGRALEAERNRRKEESFLRAVYEGDANRVRDMIDGFAEFGAADPNAKNESGISALRIAMRRGHGLVATELLGRGARRDERVAYEKENSAFWKKTAAEFAGHGDWERVEMILERARPEGAAIDVKDRSTFWLEPWIVVAGMEKALNSGRDEEALRILRINRDFLRMDLGATLENAESRALIRAARQGSAELFGELLKDLGTKALGAGDLSSEVQEALSACGNPEAREAMREALARTGEGGPAPEMGEMAQKLHGRRLKAGESAEDLEREAALGLGKSRM